MTITVGTIGTKSASDRIVTFDRNSGLVEVTHVASRRREAFALVVAGRIVAIEPEGGADLTFIRSTVSHALATVRH